MSSDNRQPPPAMPPTDLPTVDPAKRRAQQSAARRHVVEPTTRAYERASNIEAEASVLGGIFLRPEMLTLLHETQVDDFTHPWHQAVFMAMRNLESAQAPIDVLTVQNELQRVGKLEAVGGLAFLGELTMRVPSPENVVHYGGIIKGHRITREVVRAMSESIAILANYEEDVAGEDAIHLVTDRLHRIEISVAVRGKTMGDIVSQTYARVMQDIARKEAGERIMPGMPTGIPPIDVRTGGVPFSVLSVIGARPGHGKTTAAMTIVNTATTDGDDDSLFFSFEDGEASFGARNLAQASGVATNKIIARDLDGTDVRKLGEAYKKLRTKPDTLVMAAGMYVEDVCRYIKAFRRRKTGKLGTSRTRGRLAVVDYLQKMPLNPEYKGRRNEALGHITRTLSWLAQEEEMAILLLSQFGRDVEKRDDPTPTMIDFKDTGDIEQDMKFAIGLLYRYKLDRKADPNLLEAHILKNHNGESNALVSLHWDLPTHTLSDSAIALPQARARASWGAGGERFDDVPLPEDR